VDLLVSKWIWAPSRVDLLTPENTINFAHLT